MGTCPTPGRYDRRHHHYIPMIMNILSPGKRRRRSPLPHSAILLTALALTFSSSSAQERDIRSQRLVLDDNNGNTLTLATPSGPMTDSREIILPEPSVSATALLLADPPAGSSGQSVTGSLMVTGDLTAGSLATTVLTGPASGNFSILSNGSVVIGIDSDDDGSGSSFAVESNSNATPDLFRVTETGLTSITSSSGTAGLRVTNTNGSGSAPIISLEDGSAERFVVKRNGDAELTGNLEVMGTVSIGGFAVAEQESQTALGSGVTLTPSTSLARIGGNGGPVTLNGTTAISNGSQVGQILLLLGSSDANSVTINDGANTALGSSTRTLGLNDALTLLWTGSDWIETAFSDN